MPDLLGLAVSLCALYYIIFSNKRQQNRDLGFFFVGLLAGIRLSYIPLLVLPMLNLFLKNKKKLRALLFIFFGVIYSTLLAHEEYFAKDVELKISILEIIQRLN